MVSLTPKMSGKICNNLEKCHEVNKSQNTSAICFKWVEANLFMYFSEDNISYHKWRISEKQEIFLPTSLAFW